MRILLIIACILFIVALGVVIPSFLFIGIGYIVSIFFKITLFDATVLCTVSTFVLYFILVTAIYTFMEKVSIKGYIGEHINKERRSRTKSKIHAVE